MRASTRARDALLRRQQPDGHWVFELEADATIPAEFVLLLHFLDRPDPALEAGIGNLFARIQGAHGGWPLFHDGAMDISASVKAYFALKMLGDDPAALHMQRARDAILAAGGAERSNVFTPRQLALFGEVPWRAVPVMPGRDHAAAALVPVPPGQGQLLVAHRAGAAAGADGVAADGPQPARHPCAGAIPHPAGAGARLDPGAVPLRLGHVFKHLDGVLRAVQPFFPKSLRARPASSAPSLS